MTLTNPSTGYINSPFDRMPPPLRSAASPAQAAYGLACWLAFGLVALALLLAVTVLPGLQLRRMATQRCARLYLALVAARPRGGRPRAAAGHTLRGGGQSRELPRRPHPRRGPASAVRLRDQARDDPGALRPISSCDASVPSSWNASIRAAAPPMHAASSRWPRRATAWCFSRRARFAPSRGLRRFQGGAFAAAVRGRVPVVPVVIRGSRAMLAADMRLPRPLAAGGAGQATAACRRSRRCAGGPAPLLPRQHPRRPARARPPRPGVLTGAQPAALAEPLWHRIIAPFGRDPSGQECTRER
jgi:hypothetical protein